MAQILQVGLIGWGLSAKVFHVPFLSHRPEKFKIKAVLRSKRSDSQQAQAQAQAATAMSLTHFPETIVFDEMSKFLECGLDLAVIASPNHLHFPMARDCLERGLHVVVEKPFTLTTAEADELIHLAQSRSLVLAVFHNRTFDGDFSTIKSILSSGDHLLGRIVQFESSVDRFRPEPREGSWREMPAGDDGGSGILFDLGPHLIQQALELFSPEQLVSVCADVLHQRDFNRSHPDAPDDAFEVRLVFSSGVRCVLKASMLANQPGPRFSVRGTRGSFMKFGMDPQEASLRCGDMDHPRTHVLNDPGFGRELNESHWGLLKTMDGTLESVETLKGDYGRFYDNVYDVVTGRSGADQLAVSPQMARAVMRVLDLARLSNGSVVEYKH